MIKHPLLLLAVSLLVTVGVAQAATYAGFNPSNNYLFQPRAMETYRTLILVGLLMHYRKTKRFKERECNTLWGFLDHNIVEVIMGVLIAPNLTALLPSLAGAG